MNQIPYADLKKQYHSNIVIPYYELLLTTEWNIRREQIISRDSSTCTKCGKQETEYFPGM